MNKMITPMPQTFAALTESKNFEAKNVCVPNQKKIMVKRSNKIYLRIKENLTKLKHGMRYDCGIGDNASQATMEKSDIVNCFSLNKCRLITKHDI